MSSVICCDYKLVYVCGNNNEKEKLEWSALICCFNFGLIGFRWLPCSVYGKYVLVTATRVDEDR